MYHNLNHKLRVINLVLSMLGISFIYAQENIEDYLLSDSLEIQSLVGQPVLLAEEEQIGTEMRAFTYFGLSARNFTKFADLNTSFDSLEYGQVPETGLGWTFGSRMDIGDHFSVGYAYLSNFFFNGYNAGPSYSSRYTYFSFLLDIAYRQVALGLEIVPGVSLGFSQNTLSMKPNDQESISWHELHQNNNLITSVSQADFSLGVNVSLSKYLQRQNGNISMIDLKVGMLYHPFHFGEVGVTSVEWKFVDVVDMPSISSTGFYLTLIYGVSSSQTQ